MFSMVCFNFEYGWFMLVSAEVSVGHEVYRCFSCEDKEHAFRLLDILRYGIDVEYPLFNSGLHFKEAYDLVDI